MQCRDGMHSYNVGFISSGRWVRSCRSIHRGAAQQLPLTSAGSLGRSSTTWAQGRCWLVTAGCTGTTSLRCMQVVPWRWHGSGWCSPLLGRPPQTRAEITGSSSISVSVSRTIFICHRTALQCSTAGHLIHVPALWQRAILLSNADMISTQEVHHDTRLVGMIRSKDLNGATPMIWTPQTTLNISLAGPKLCSI